MNKKIKYFIVFLLVILIVGCSYFIFFRNIKNNEDGGSNNNMNLERTGWTNDVPSSYKNKAKEQGKIEAIHYETIDYTNNKEITKTAKIYLPFGYTEDNEYNIFYLMHGWGEYAGYFYDYSNIVNILDNMIENGDIEPLIVVSATFDAENQEQGWGRSVEQLEPFHLDFENALMPYVESHYSTYAKSTSKEDLIASRNHRAFGGFSLGGVTTWYMFQYDLDYIKYFLPMSGDSWCIGTFGGLYSPKETVDYLEKVVEEYKHRDFLVYSGLGTKDARYDQVNNQMVEMLKRDTFKDNFVYYQVKDAYHDMNATDEEMYNGLPYLFED